MSWQTPENLSADGIRAVVTGTSGSGKAITDDGASGLVWAAPGGNPAIADITDWPSGLTATEIGYVNGVTSAIQTQLDAKVANSVLTTNGDLLTRTAGVPARLGLGSARQRLRTNEGATALEYVARPYLVFKATRNTTQTGNSGSYAANPVVWNNITSNDTAFVTHASGILTFQKACIATIFSQIRKADGSSDWSLYHSLNGGTSGMPTQYESSANGDYIWQMVSRHTLAASDEVRVCGAFLTGVNFTADDTLIEVWIED